MASPRCAEAYKHRRPVNEPEVPPVLTNAGWRRQLGLGWEKVCPVVLKGGMIRDEHADSRVCDSNPSV